MKITEKLIELENQLNEVLEEIKNLKMKAYMLEEENEIGRAHV